jgi:hypothetical protein
MTAVLRLLSRRGEPSRRVRRAMVAFGAVSIPALVVLMVAGAREVGLGLLVVLVVLLMAPLVIVTEFRRNVFRRKNADERERQRRNDAYRLSYRFVEWGVAVVALLFAFSQWLEAIPGWDWFGVWLLSMWYVIFLPYMIFAWREPDAVD